MQILFFLVVLVVVSGCSNREQGQNDRSKSYVCGFSDSYISNSTYETQADDDNRDTIIKNEFKYLWHNVVGGRSNTITFLRDDGTFTNEYKYAAATKSISPSGNIERYIYYKPSDITKDLLNDANDLPFKAIALHELGHQINGDLLKEDDKEVIELGADDYAGFRFAGEKLNVPLESGILIYKKLTDINPKNGYPAQEKRLEAFAGGWKRNHGDSAKHSIIASLASTVRPDFEFVSLKNHSFNKIIIGIRENKIDFIDSSFFSAKKDTTNIELFARDSSRVRENLKYKRLFYLDHNYLYYKASNNLVPVGRIAESNRKEYQRMVYDKFYNYMYIDSNNNLIFYDKPSSTTDSSFVIIGKVKGG